MPVAHDHHGSRSIVERAAIAGGDRAVGAKCWLERRHCLQRCAWARPVIGTHHGAVRQRHRRNLGIEDAIRYGLLGKVLGAYAELVLLGTRDAAQGGDILGGLTHRNVDVRQHCVLARIVPGLVAQGSVQAALLSGCKDRIMGVDRIDAGGAEAAVARDAFHAGRDKGLALTGPDRVVGHPGGLHTRGAEAIDRGSGDIVQPELHGNATRHIAALLVAWLGAADVDIVERTWVQRIDLGKGCRDHPSGKIIRTNLGQ